MTAFLQHFSFEFRTGIRNRSLLFLTYLFPLAVYLMLGALMTAVNPFFADTMIPAMVLFAVLSGTLLGMPDLLVSTRKAGIFRSYKINGIPATSILIIPALSSFFHLCLISAIITISAPLFFDAPLPANWMAFILVLLVTLFAFAGLSLLIGTISTSSQMTVLFSQLIFLPSMILGGLMMPTSILPEALKTIALLLPTTQAMNAFRALAYNLPADFSPWISVLVLFSGGLIAFILAIFLFNWDANDSGQRKRSVWALLALLPYVAGMLWVLATI